MRRIINSTYISLDGVIENPHEWPSSRHEDDGTAGTLQTELLFSCDAVLMGRRTYDGFASVWPERSGDPYTDRINGMVKYVASSTLQDPIWANTTILTGDPLEAIERLKHEPGQDIVQYGFGELSHALMARGLLDELRRWVHPFFVGHGGPNDLMFRECAPHTFDIVGVQTLVSGIVVLYYAKTSA
jgi:dihydrofolate reductase